MRVLAATALIWIGLISTACGMWISISRSKLPAVVEMAGFDCVPAADMPYQLGKVAE